MTIPLSARPDLSCRGFVYDVLMMIKTAIFLTLMMKIVKRSDFFFYLFPPLYG